MKHLTIVMPYYMNPGMLALHYRNWSFFPAELKKKIDIVIVDDGSPEKPAADVPRPPGLPSVRIYRVMIDIPWNQHGARNLGAYVAEGPWLLMTDMDHLMLPAQVENLLKYSRSTCVYTFDRKDAPNLTPTMKRDLPSPHVNSFALTKDAYWQVGGYDEDYCGMYGTDGLFRHRLYTQFAKTHLNDVFLVRYPREVVPDASTTTLERRPEGSVKGPTKRRREWKEKMGRANYISTLNFKWERVH